MTTQNLNPASVAVHKTLHVACGAAHAFEVFTGRMGLWWPPSHHIGREPFREVLIDRKPGGSWYEIDAAGNTCVWGRVLAFEPPHKVLLSWHLNPDFVFDPDPSRASEVEVRFIAEGAQKTRVEFTHRHLERHGQGFEQLRDAVDSPNGWISILQGFVVASERSA